jgi:hypothetical protein
MTYFSYPFAETKLGREIFPRHNNTYVDVLQRNDPKPPFYYRWGFTAEYPAFPARPLSEWSLMQSRECKSALEKGSLYVIDVQKLNERPAHLRRKFRGIAGQLPRSEAGAGQLDETVPISACRKGFTEGSSQNVGSLKTQTSPLEQVPSSNIYNSHLETLSSPTESERSSSPENLDDPVALDSLDRSPEIQLLRENEQLSGRAVDNLDWKTESLALDDLAAALTERGQKWRAMTEGMKEMLRESQNREEDFRVANAKQAARIEELEKSISENASAALQNTNLTSGMEYVLGELGRTKALNDELSENIRKHAVQMAEYEQLRERVQILESQLAEKTKEVEDTKAALNTLAQASNSRSGKAPVRQGLPPIQATNSLPANPSVKDITGASSFQPIDPPEKNVPRASCSRPVSGPVKETPTFGESSTLAAIRRVAEETEKFLKTKGGRLSGSDADMAKDRRSFEKSRESERASNATSSFGQGSSERKHRIELEHRADIKRSRSEMRELGW